MKEDTEKEGKHYLTSRSKKTKFQHYPLKEEVLDLLNDNNFKKPTQVQAESLPITLQDHLKNLCVIIYAYNGAGKTLTYLIPVFNALQNIPAVGQKFEKNKDHQIGRPQAVIVVPTEALLAQVYDYLVAYSDFYQMTFKWGIKIGRIYGTVFENGHIIVGLPKKVQQYFGGPSMKFDLSQLKWVIFDQCDQLKEDSLHEFTDLLRDGNINTSAANFLITSATGDKDNFRTFIQNNLVNHNIVELDAYEQNKGLLGVSHFYSQRQDKENVIFRLLELVAKAETQPQVIIFFNTIPELRYFYTSLRKEKNRFVINDPQASDIGKNNLKVDYIHRDCSAICMKSREHLHPFDCAASKTTRITKLRNKEIQVLLGTDVIGRGIDIRTVTLVINYSEPTKNKQLSSTSYIHRVGRTGRYSDEGVALTFATPKSPFINIAEQQQKIKFVSMPSEDEIIKRTIECFYKNQRITQNDKHRFEYE